MVRKIFSFVLILSLMGFATNAYANAENLFEGIVTKLGRGIVNTCTGWMELPSQIVKGHDQGFIDNNLLRPVGLVQGLVDGVTHSMGRTISGVVDIATFWSADPSDENSEGVGLKLDGENAWEHGEPESIGEPGIVEGALMPIGRKFMRGVGNLLFGFVELPGQVIKGISEGAYDAGIVKGVWYSVSREINGAADIVTFLLPTPAENKGLAYDEVWPWSAFGDTIQKLF